MDLSKTPPCKKEKKKIEKKISLDVRRNLVSKTDGLAYTLSNAVQAMKNAVI